VNQGLMVWSGSDKQERLKRGRKMKKKLLVGLALGLSFAAMGNVNLANAADFDFSGALTQDNDVFQFNFTVGAQSDVTVFSSSWDDGGFDPILAIWTNAGALIYQQDDGGNTGSTLSNGISYDHGVWDSYYNVNLVAGSYIATVTQFDNFANSTSLSDGFIYDNDPHFTFTEGYGSQADFNGVWTSNDPRTGDYSFHVLNVASANTVPEPATMLLFGTGLAGLVCARLRRKK